MVQAVSNHSTGTTGTRHSRVRASVPALTKHSSLQAHTHGVYVMRSYYVRQGEKDLFKGSPHVLEVVSYRVIRFLPCEWGMSHLSCEPSRLTPPACWLRCC